MRRITALFMIIIMCAAFMPALCCYAEEGVAVNEYNFPDEGLRNMVAYQFDADGNGILDAGELGNITGIYSNSTRITDTKGIELFPELKVINLTDCNLRNIDVSGNPGLEELVIAQNPYVSGIDVSANKMLEKLRIENVDISSIDLSNNTRLRELSLINVNIGSLDVSNNRELTHLNADKCGLSAIDVSNNDRLKVLSFTDNNISGFDVSGIKSLETINCSNNPLGNIDITANFMLEQLSCDKCGLKSLDVTRNTSLKTIICSNNKIAELDLRNNTDLVNLLCQNNKLAGLNLDNNRKLSHLDASNNILSIGDPDKYDFSVHKLIDFSRASDWVGADYNSNTNRLENVESDTISYIYNCGNGYSMRVVMQATDGGIEINSANFPDDALRKMVSSYDTDKNGKLSMRERQIGPDHFGTEVNNLTGLDYFFNIGTLRIDKSYVRKVNFKSCKNVTQLEISSCSRLDSVNMGKEPSLLRADISDCPVLTYLDLSECGTKSGNGFIIKINKCPKLEKLILPSVCRYVGNSYSGAYKFCLSINNSSALKQLVFTGNAPDFADDAFKNIKNMTVIYPSGNSTWTRSIMKNYSGTGIIWKSHNEAADEVNENSADTDNRRVQAIGLGGRKYKLNTNSKPFYLKTQARTGLSYSTSNRSVATVDSSGRVNIVGPGTAVIRVTAAENDQYFSAFDSVTIEAKLAVPSLKVTALKGKKAKLTWSKVKGADGYRIYIKGPKDKKFKLRLTKSAKVKSVTHKGLKKKKKYQYKIVAYKKVGNKYIYSSYSPVRNIKVGR